MEVLEDGDRLKPSDPVFVDAVNTLKLQDPEVQAEVAVEIIICYYLSNFMCSVTSGCC